MSPPTEEPEDPDTIAATGAPTPLESAERTQAVQVLYGLLDKLEYDRREVFVMSELEQLSAPEIAEALHVNLNTVYWRLRTARQEFEEAVSRYQATGVRRQR